MQPILMPLAQQDPAVMQAQLVEPVEPVE